MHGARVNAAVPADDLQVTCYQIGARFRIPKVACMHDWPPRAVADLPVFGSTLMRHPAARCAETKHYAILAVLSDISCRDTDLKRPASFSRRAPVRIAFLDAPLDCPLTGRICQPGRGETGRGRSCGDAAAVSGSRGDLAARPFISIPVTSRHCRGSVPRRSLLPRTVHICQADVHGSARLRCAARVALESIS